MMELFVLIVLIKSILQMIVENTGGEPLPPRRRRR